MSKVFDTKYSYGLYVGVTVRAEVVRLSAEKRTVEGRTFISTCNVVGEPEPTIEWRRADRDRPYVLGPQPVRDSLALLRCLVSKFKHRYFYSVSKTCDHIVDDKLNYNCPFTKIFGTLITKCIGHRQVFFVSHLTYLMQLLYLGKLARPKYYEFRRLKLLIFSMLQY